MKSEANYKPLQTSKMGLFYQTLEALIILLSKCERVTRCASEMDVFG